MDSIINDHMCEEEDSLLENSQIEKNIRDKPTQQKGEFDFDFGSDINWDELGLSIGAKNSDIEETEIKQYIIKQEEGDKFFEETSNCNFADFG